MDILVYREVETPFTMTTVAKYQSGMTRSRVECVSLTGHIIGAICMDACDDGFWDDDSCGYLTHPLYDINKHQYMYSNPSQD